MIKKENHALEYLYFRFPSDHALIFGPFVIAVTGIFFSLELSQLSLNVFQEILNGQFSYIENYLVNFKLAFVILSSFFICYRWSLYKKDGSYGYWLTQGVKRKKFFLMSYLSFVFDSYTGIYLGLLTIIYIYGIAIPDSNLLILVILIFISYSVLITIAVFIGELVKDPELALLSFVALYALLFAIPDVSVATKIFNPEFEFNSPDYPVWLGLSALMGLVTFVSTFILHMRRDLEL